MNKMKNKKLFHLSRYGKISSFFLSILLTPFQSSHKETKYHPIQNLVKCNSNFEFGSTNKVNCLPCS